MDCCAERACAPLISYRIVCNERSRHRAVRQARRAPGALVLEDFVHVMNVLQFWMYRAFRAYFTAEAAGDAESFFDSDFHGAVESN
jgi:hypothetical protein